MAAHKRHRPGAVDPLDALDDAITGWGILLVRKSVAPGHWAENRSASFSAIVLFSWRAWAASDHRGLSEPPVAIAFDLAGAACRTYVFDCDPMGYSFSRFNLIRQ